MKKIVVRWVCTTGVLILGLCFLMSSMAVAEPTVLEITSEPGHLAPLSTITFTARLSGENISEVYIIVKECKGEDQCFFPKINESMTKDAMGEYQAKVTLKHAKADNIGFWLVVKSDDGFWYDFQDDVKKIGLTVGPSDDDKGIPGFELVTMIFVIVMILFVFKKRKRI